MELERKNPVFSAKLLSSVPPQLIDYQKRKQSFRIIAHYLLRCGNLRIIEKEFSQNNSEGTPKNDFFNFLEPKKRPESSI